MNDASVTVFRVDYLRLFTEQVFRYFEVPAADARQAADVLLSADLKGIDSHGVARLRTYVDMLTHRRINPTPRIQIVRERKSVCTVDGDNGLGLVVGPAANRIAMDRADQYGSGWVSVCHTNHYGIASYYALEALKRDHQHRMQEIQMKEQASAREHEIRKIEAVGVAVCNEVMARGKAFTIGNGLIPPDDLTGVKVFQ